MRRIDLQAISQLQQEIVSVGSSTDARLPRLEASEPNLVRELYVLDWVISERVRPTTCQDSVRSRRQSRRLPSRRVRRSRIVVSFGSHSNSVWRKSRRRVDRNI